MLTLLLIVVICGILAWVIQSLNMPQPFKTIGVAILVIIVVLSFFDFVLGVRLPLSVR